MEEIWNEIPEFEGKYQASNFGRIKSLNYLRTGKEQILKLLNDKDGYLLVNLSKNGKVKTYKVHRLVWCSFNGKIPEGKQINHKDEDKTNNTLDNLELVTCKENINYGAHNERMAKAKSKPVFQYDLEGNLINKWCSTREVERELGFSQGNISKCCLDIYKQAYGYVWKYQ